MNKIYWVSTKWEDGSISKYEHTSITIALMRVEYIVDSLKREAHVWVEEPKNDASITDKEK